MRLIELRVDGFGKLVGRRIVFDPGFTIVYGPNEAGKSTLETAIVATLFGVGRKDDREAWRPWTSQRYATVLRYALEDGRTFEVQRDFDRDPKSVRVYDENGNDVSAELSVGKVVNPGHAHLRIPLEVFLNASCVEQGKAQIDGARAERISSMLAHALDGGPREDAALGAIARLDEALKTHVGTPRATVRAPLRRLTEELDEHRTRADEIRAALRRLDDLRSRLEAEEQRSGDLAAALGEHDRLGRSLRAHVVRSRLESLRDVRDDVAALDAERANYDDVDDIVPGRIGDLDGRFADWRAAEAHASSAAEAAAEARLTPTLEAELAERLRDGGAVDDDGFAALQRAVDEASDARAKATNAAARMQTARRSIEGGNELFGALMAGSAVILMLAVVLAIVHAWAWALPVTALAATGLGAATHRWNHRKRTVAAIDALERGADAAVIAERDANTRVAAVLEPLGVSSIEELARRRERARELLEARSVARRAADRAGAARSAAQAAGRHFDELAKTYIVASGSREADMESARKRDARRSARDGIDLRLSMYEVRRRDVVADDDEFALESELADLLAAGVAPAPIAGSQRAFEAERASLERRCAESRASAAATAAELRASEAMCGDLASLDEKIERLDDEARHLQRFGAAVELARTMIDDRTREAHQKFARRLTDYASRTLSSVTGGRYSDVRVDPTTLALKVRAPETGAIVEVDRLSAGTRDQAYLVVRLAMCRMFAEGLEPAPLLLDDPFAYWDEVRIERSFPLLQKAAEDGQIVMFTTSRELATAAAQRGARRIDLDDPSTFELSLLKV